MLSHGMDWPAFSCIACLRFRIGPSAVIGTVSLIVIYPVDTEIVTVMLVPTVGYRPLIEWKELLPFVTYVYPSAFIILMTIASRYNIAP